MKSLLSPVYWMKTVPICLRLEAQEIVWARARAEFSAGSSMAARIAMMAITTRSSISVKYFFISLLPFQLGQYGKYVVIQ